jgi:signal transduction histidine kinase
VAATIYSQAGDVAGSVQAMRHKVFEMDSVFSDVQDAHYDQLATGRTLMRTREEAAANKRAVQRLTNWIFIIIVAFLIIYIMGRRRLVRKIWAKNKDLRAALSRAEESDRMKSTFIQSMSHEIRTPLNAVSGFAGVICSPDYELSDAEKRDMQARISDNVAQITAIINDLLELSQSESEAVIPDSEKTDVCVNSLARTVIFRPVAPTAVFRDKGCIVVFVEFPVVFFLVVNFQKEHPSYLFDSLGIAIDTCIIAHDVSDVLYKICYCHF